MRVMKLPQLPTKKILTLDAAKQIATAAHVEAARNNWKMVIAIVDDGAHLLYLERMDGALLGSIPVAQEKASTAARFKRPSKALEEAVVGGRNVIMTLPGTLPIE